VVICLERGADLHMVQLMPLPLTVSCFSKIQIGFTFLLPAHPGSPGQWAVKRVCVCVCVCVCACVAVQLVPTALQQLTKFQLAKHTCCSRATCNKVLQRRDDSLPPPANDLCSRMGLQSAHLWWPVVAKLQAASMPIA